MELNKPLHEKSKAHLLVGTFFLLIGEGIVRLDPMSYEPLKMKIYLFTVLPGIILIASWIFIYKKEKFRNFILVVSVIVFFIGIIRGYIGLGWETSGPFEDIKYYKRILSENKYPTSTEISHFPEEIPKSASKVKMVYGRPFLQARGYLLLSMIVDEDEFNRVLERFNINKEELPKNKRDVRIDDFSNRDFVFQSQIKDHWRITDFRQEEEYIYPDDFFFLKEGVAVSLPRREVIYWLFR